MRFKIATDGNGGCLCRTCEEGRVFTRANGAEEAWCHAGGMESYKVPLDIVKCTDYEDKRRVSRYDLEKVAWEIKHDNSGRIVGFTPPKKQE